MQTSSPVQPAGTIDDSIKVLIRIRPPDGGSSSSTSSSSLVPPATPRKTANRDPNAFEVEANTIAEPKAGLNFTFDHVANQNAAQVSSLKLSILRRIPFFDISYCFFHISIFFLSLRSLRS